MLQPEHVCSFMHEYVASASQQHRLIVWPASFAIKHRVVSCEAAHAYTLVWRGLPKHEVIRPPFTREVKACTGTAGSVSVSIAKKTDAYSFSVCCDGLCPGKNSPSGCKYILRSLSSGFLYSWALNSSNVCPLFVVGVHGEPVVRSRRGNRLEINPRFEYAAHSFR